MIDNLDLFKSKEQDSNDKYYTNTLTNLLDKLFHPEEDEDDANDVKRDINKMNMIEGQSGMLKQMKKQIFEVPSYVDVD